jgi:hypothetical protein
LIGFTAEEARRIREDTKGCELTPDVELVLRSTHDRHLGKTAHKVCLKRLLHSMRSTRTGDNSIATVAEGRTKFFTSRLVDTGNVAGWNRANEWGGTGPGSRISMTDRLDHCLQNGVTWASIEHAMNVQAKDHAGGCGPLQTSLIRVIEVVTYFASTRYAQTLLWPVNFLVELMLFLLDTVIAGPKATSSWDARRRLDAATLAPDLLSTARLLEPLHLAVKDPTGNKKMTVTEYYNDETCTEEIHEFFVQIYSNSAEHAPMMIEISAECANRRQNHESVCGGDPAKTHEYLSICTIANLFLARETATRALRKTSRYQRPLSTTPAQRTASIALEKAVDMEDLSNRVAAVLSNGVAAAEQGAHFRSGGGAGGVQPPRDGPRFGGSTAQGGILRAMRDLKPVSGSIRIPSYPGSDAGDGAPTFVGKDGVTRHSGKGMPDVRLNDAVNQLKDEFQRIGKVLSLRYLHIPKDIDPWEFIQMCRFEPYHLKALWNEGNCSEEVKLAMAYISPATAYGGPNEPKTSVYSDEDKKMVKLADGTEKWEKGSCLHCLNAPPWNLVDGPPPPVNSPESLMYRNEVSTEHNPKTCPARMLAGLATDCQPLIECIRPDPKKMALARG